MVDPVTFGPVYPVKTQSAAGRADTAAKSGTAHVGSTSPPATAAAPSLPKLVHLAAELASQGPPVDYARIAPIRQAIAMGAYRIDHEAIASALLAGANAA